MYQMSVLYQSPFEVHLHVDLFAWGGGGGGQFHCTELCLVIVLSLIMNDKRVANK